MGSREYRSTGHCNRFIHVYIYSIDLEPLLGGDLRNLYLDYVRHWFWFGSAHLSQPVLEFDG